MGAGNRRPGRSSYSRSEQPLPRLHDELLRRASAGCRSCAQHVPGSGNPIRGQHQQRQLCQRQASDARSAANAFVLASWALPGRAGLPTAGDGGPAVPRGGMRRTARVHAYMADSVTVAGDGSSGNQKKKKRWQLGARIRGRHDGSLPGALTTGTGTVGMDPVQSGIQPVRLGWVFSCSGW